MAIPLTGTLVPSGAFPIVDKDHVGNLGTAAGSATTDFEAAGAAAAAIVTANGYTDTEVASAVTTANGYTDTAITTLSGSVTTALGGKVDKVTGKGLSAEDYTTAEKTKLSGIEAGAKTLPSQTGQSGKVLGTTGSALQWVTPSSGGGGTWGSITGTLSDQTDLATALSGKVNTVTGKGLSTEDYTTAEKTKLSGVSAGATANSTDDHLLDRANHTGTQSATTIIEDSTHRFASDTEKAAWNAKQASLPNADATHDGILTKTDWATFNGKQVALPNADSTHNGILTQTDWSTFNGKQSALGFTPRYALSADLTLYCNYSTGADTNNGLTSGTPFKTIQKSLDYLATLDGGGHDAIIQLADGTYSEAPAMYFGVAAQANVKATVGFATITIQGNASTPSNVVVSTTSGICICNSVAHSTLIVKDLKVQTTTGGYGIAANNFGYVEVSNIIFGSCVSSQLYGRFGGLIWVNGNCQWTGNSAGGVHANNGKIYFLDSTTQTMVSTPGYSVAFARADLIGFIQCNCTFSGAATGSRYTISMNSVIQTFGKGATYFPGNAVGSAATGGQYA